MQLYIKLQSLKIIFRHLLRVPKKRFYLRVKDLIRRKLKFNKIINSVQLNNIDDRNFKNEKLKNWIIGVRGCNLDDNVVGSYLIRGLERNIGSMKDFDFHRLVCPYEEDVNWLYELTYLSIFLKDDNYSDYELGEINQFLSGIEDKKQRSYSSNSLAWTVISASNRLINLYAICNKLKNENCPQSLIDKAIRHGDICRSYVGEFTEYYLHYNHLLFGLAAQIVWDSSYPRNTNTLQSKIVEFIHCLKEQLNEDGFHAELSPTYHLHVGFLVKCVMNICFTKKEHSELDYLFSLMNDAIFTLIHPDNEIAIFNDSAVFDAPAPRLIFNDTSKSDYFTQLSSSGFYKYSNKTFCVIFDAGIIGPSDNPGHGHVDFLSFELSVHSKRYIVDPGVASYKKGKLRDFSRSEAFHNGPSLIGCKLADLAGAFQVGDSSLCRLIYKNFSVNNCILIGEITLPKKINTTIRRLIYVDDDFFIVVDLAFGSELDESLFIYSDYAEKSNYHGFEVVGLFNSTIRKTATKYYPYGPGYEVNSGGFYVYKNLKDDQSMMGFVLKKEKITLPKKLISKLKGLILKKHD